MFYFLFSFPLYILINGDLILVFIIVRYVISFPFQSLNDNFNVIILICGFLYSLYIYI